MGTKEIWTLIIRADFTMVFKAILPPVLPGAVSIVEIPSDVAYGPYNHLQIEIKREGGQP